MSDKVKMARNIATLRALAHMKEDPEIMAALAGKINEFRVKAWFTGFVQGLIIGGGIFYIAIRTFQ